MSKTYWSWYKNIHFTVGKKDIPTLTVTKAGQAIANNVPALIAETWWYRQGFRCALRFGGDFAPPIERFYIIIQHIYAPASDSTCCRKHILTAQYLPFASVTAKPAHAPGDGTRTEILFSLHLKPSP